jgi:molybdopterin/thiamine biosynthesis adenylyltransferase
VRVIDTNVEALLRPANLVIDCVDNLATRRLLSIEASRTKKPLLHGAISANGDYARSIWDERFEADAEPSTGNTATCENGDHLPFVIIASAYIAQAVKTYVIKGVKENFEISPTHVRRYLT